MCPTLVETLSSETAEKQRFGLMFTFEFRKIKFPDIWRDSHEIEKEKIIHALLDWEAEEKSGTEGPNNVDHDQKEHFSSTWLISRRCERSMLLNSNKNKISASSTYFFRETLPEQNQTSSLLINTDKCSRPNEQEYINTCEGPRVSWRPISHSFLKENHLLYF